MAGTRRKRLTSRDAQPAGCAHLSSTGSCHGEGVTTLQKTRPMTTSPRSAEYVIRVPMGGGRLRQGSTPASSRPIMSPPLNTRNMKGTNKSPARAHAILLAIFRVFRAFSRATSRFLGLASPHKTPQFARTQVFSMQPRCYSRTSSAVQQELNPSRKEGACS